MNIEEQIEKIEKEIRETPYHKGTEHHIGRLRARIARLKDKLYQESVKKSDGTGFAVKKQGDATVVLVGFPSVGKSTLLNQLTNTKSKIAPYPFTTLTVIPGMMRYNGSLIQILDVPGLITGAASGKGRGKQVISICRGADLIILISEIGKGEEINLIEKELSQAGVRLDQESAQIKIKKTNKGGLKIKGLSKNSRLNQKMIEGIAQEFRLVNGEIIIMNNPSQEELVDALAGNRVFLPGLRVVNKMDLITDTDKEKDKGGDKELIFVSAEKGEGLRELRNKIWEKLGLIRIYLRKEGKIDKEEPLILKEGSTARMALEKIHLDLVEEVKEVKLWGKSAQHPGQKISLTQPLDDEDVISFSK